MFRQDYKKIAATLIEFIKEQAAGKDLLIGISGGIDSTLCAFLALKAVGQKRLHLVIAPSKYTAEADFQDAIKFAQSLSPKKLLVVEHEKLDVIRVTYDAMIPSTGESENIIMDAYVRNTLLRRYSRLYDCRVVGTINGTEWHVGYYPKYTLIGDMLPIADLFKTQIFELAAYLRLPKSIIEKRPTLSLGCAPTAKEEKPSYIDRQLIASRLNYKQLDLILVGIDEGRSIKQIAKAGKGIFTLKQVKIVYDLVKKFRHKKELPLYPKIN